jgi:hypothetical protein
MFGNDPKPPTKASFNDFRVQMKDNAMRKWWPKQFQGPKLLKYGPDEPSNSHNSLRFSQPSAPDKLKTMVLTEQDGARNFLSGGLLGHLPTAFPVVTEPTSRALAHQLKDLREIALTGIPFDRGKPNQESQTSRAKRLR